GILAKEGKKISSLPAHDENEIEGINTRCDLAKVNAVLNTRKLNELMSRGVTIMDSATVFINPGAKIGKDTLIYPFTFIERDVVIGRNCFIGPFCRLRPGTVIENNVAVGNFAELNRAHVKNYACIKHQSYLGDTTVGEKTNIGAGTIVANWDGKKKHRTLIGDNVLVGSGSIFVAPVKVGRKAVTGAGTVITKKNNIPAGATVVGVPAHILRRKNEK
ncbi:MAG: DapH/DapD/GlmU-related protein, partial [Candidatus Omnitrophota bacterium]